MKIDVNNKLLLKILSGFVAIFLWAAITYTEDPVISQSVTGIKVIFEGEDELTDNGLVITNAKSLPDISVVIRGTRSNVISSMNSITAVADVSGISSEGSNLVSLKYNYPSGGVTLVKSKTQEITLETEKLVSRSIPIKVKTTNQDKNLTHLIEATASQDSMQIRGSESEVYKIEYAKAVLDVAEITESDQKEYTYKFYDAEDDIVAGNTIIYKKPNTINIVTNAYKKITVPVIAVLDEKLSDNYVLKVKNIGAQTIDVGISEGTVLNGIDAIIADQMKTQEEIALSIPEGVYIPEDKRTVKVEYQLEPKVMKEIEVPVSAVNVPEGKSAEITPQKIKISVRGAENEILADKIKAQIDLSVPENGKYEVQFSTSKEIEITGSYTVEAEIN